MKNNIKPGEIWTFVAQSKQVQEALILNTFENCKYVNYLLLHPTKKGSNNVAISSMSGVMYCDPRKISYGHNEIFTGFVRGIPDVKLAEIRTEAANAIGFIGENGDSITQQLASSQASVEMQRKKIQELMVYKDVYERFIETVCNNMVKGLYGNTDDSGEAESKPEMTEEEIKAYKLQKTKEKQAAKKRKYGLKQSYIGVEIRRIGMTGAATARLLGKGDSTVNHWINGTNPADWKALERIFPGIEARANEYVKQMDNVKQQKGNEK